MGRKVTFVEVENPSDIEKRIECDALIDIGASHMVLPTAWRARLGNSGSALDIGQSTLAAHVF